MELTKGSIFPPKSTFRNTTLFAVHAQLIVHHVNTKGWVTPAAPTHRGNLETWMSVNWQNWFPLAIVVSAKCLDQTVLAKLAEKMKT